jgi:hypothetical protein
MMKFSSGQATQRILELPADAQIQRRMTATDSPAFHNLTGAIAAYGKALALLTALQQREEFYAIIGQHDSLISPQRLATAKVDSQRVA